MTQRKKLLDIWLNHTPVDAPFEVVRGVLEYAVRELGFEAIRIRGSHYHTGHDILKKHVDFEGGFGNVNICVKNGQRVLKPYLKLLAQAIQIVEEES